MARELINHFTRGFAAALRERVMFVRHLKKLGNMAVHLRVIVGTEDDARREPRRRIGRIYRHHLGSRSPAAFTTSGEKQ
jgi:hypothetical protein